MAVALDGMYMSQDDISNPNSRNQPFAEPRVYIPIFAKRAVANFPYVLRRICCDVFVYSINVWQRVFAVWLVQASYTGPATRQNST